MKYILYISVLILLMLVSASCSVDEDFCYVTHCKYVTDKGVTYEYCIKEKVCYDDDISRIYE